MVKRAARTRAPGTTRRAGETLLTGTLSIPKGFAADLFDPDLLAGSGEPGIGVPTGYGNVDSNVDVEVRADWVEFGFENTNDPPAYVESVDITQLTSGYRIDWVSVLGGGNSRSGGDDVTVTLTSDAFKGCTIAQQSSTFCGTTSENIAGNIITLVTPDATGPNTQFKATWEVQCTEVRQSTAWYAILFLGGIVTSGYFHR